MDKMRNLQKLRSVQLANIKEAGRRETAPEKVEKIRFGTALEFARVKPFNA